MSVLTIFLFIVKIFRITYYCSTDRLIRISIRCCNTAALLQLHGAVQRLIAIDCNSPCPFRRIILTSENGYLRDPANYTNWSLKITMARVLGVINKKGLAVIQRLSGVLLHFCQALSATIFIELFDAR